MRGLFKMGTDGDAHICAGFLPDSGLAPAAGGSASGGHDGAAGRRGTPTCWDLLAVAGVGEMLVVVAAIQWPAGAKASCRIGLAAGTVVAGALGHLQPRCPGADVRPARNMPDPGPLTRTG